VDEMGTNTSLGPIYAYSLRGHRAYAKVPRNRGPNTTLLSSMSLEGMGPSLAVEGSINREVFEAYVERVLAATLRPGQIVMMDNLSAHKGKRVREIIEKRGCVLLYLPPTRRISTPLKRPSRRSKGSCAKLRLVVGRLWWRRWAQRSLQSVPETHEVSSNIADTTSQPNYHETRCKRYVRRRDRQEKNNYQQLSQVLPDVGVELPRKDLHMGLLGSWTSRLLRRRLSSVCGLRSNRSCDHVIGSPSLQRAVRASDLAIVLYNTK
jgi:transposase